MEEGLEKVPSRAPQASSASVDDGPTLPPLEDGKPSLRVHVKEIATHGGIFGVGVILARLTSVILLPVYTRVLTPADYGVLAILDLVQELLKLAIGTGLTSAAGRFHFDTHDEVQQSRVWWTSLLALVGLASVLLLPLLGLSTTLAAVTFGPEVPRGSYLYTLMVFSLWFGLPEGLLQTHLRIIKRSHLYVGISLARLVVNATLNIVFLYHFKMGVAGVLWGNLITGAIWTLLQLAIFVSLRGGMTVDWRLLKPMATFGFPLMAVALLSLAMHQMDRYVLLAFVSLDAIGIYSFAYQIGQGINSLVLVPFSQIWGVVIFEIARLQDAKRVFVEVFSAFVRGLLLVLLAASLGAKVAVYLLAPPDYAAAADLIPVIALAYFFFSLDDHFRVPALVHKRTTTLVPVYVIAVLLNLGLNLLLVPRWGILGAAWASVWTFVGFSVFGLKRYRRVDRIHYRMGEAASVLAACVATYVVFHLAMKDRSILANALVGAGTWIVMAAILTRRPIQAWRHRSA
jgi:O-antigen/teichoic acid export membrane protein